MEISKIKRIFGVGPLGGLISIIILLVALYINHVAGIPPVTSNVFAIRVLSASFVILGISLHLWSAVTLKSWWFDGCLCTKGPFRYFRHPMYAAWITFIVPGVALYFNSWILLLWPLLLHPIWHMLVRKEEKMILQIFGNKYREYTENTGRFVPRIF